MPTKLTDIPYIGEKTEKDLRRTIRDRRSGKTGEVTASEAASAWGSGVLKVKLDKRQRMELGKEHSNSKLRYLTDEEKRELGGNQQRGRTEPGDTIQRGDFRLDRAKFKKAREMHSERSARAKDVDEQRRARVTTDFEKWSDAKGRFDYPGVDTPQRRKPRRQSKDRPYVDPEKLLRDFEDEETNTNGGSNGGNGQSRGERLQQIRQERGNVVANVEHWKGKVKMWEEEEMHGREFDEVTGIAGDVVVELGEQFENDEGGVDAVVTGLADYDVPIERVEEDRNRIRIGATDEPRPIALSERDKEGIGIFTGQRG